MNFHYNKQDLPALKDAEGTCWLLSNGLSGYMSTSGAFSVTRCDQGLLISAQTPSRRFCLVHRLSETAEIGDKTLFLSSQTFADGRRAEEGYKYLDSFCVNGLPCWKYTVGELCVMRRCAMAYGENTSAVAYELTNRSGAPCRLTVRPVLQFAPKGGPIPDRPSLVCNGGTVTGEGLRLRVKTNGELRNIEPVWETLRYRDDEADGRSPQGTAVALFEIGLTVPAGEKCLLEILFSDGDTALGAEEIFSSLRERRRELMDRSGLSDPVARELVWASDSFLSSKPCTGGKTIIAGYPYFADWGRDTMIALHGCTLSTGRFEDAGSILRSFLRYERDGLVPNLFPEGGGEPVYNTADAALLLVNTVWQYYRRTGDGAFVREAWPTLKRIIAAYKNGTRHAIYMDSDHLIAAGEGLDQVTWMDVCVDGILPTPRHGKPVEINAYWYSALRIMGELAPLSGERGEAYTDLAGLVRESFLEKFWMEERGYLRDVLSGTAADEQLRCNQIWALTMPFTMLSPDRERRVVDTVYRHLYTSRGLRTLSPEDPEFHPVYGGPQRERDLAYHQGTVWPFPLGAWYLAYLKVHGSSPEAAARVRVWLGPMTDILREGCVGQIPEIYDGLHPGPSRGCFAQAWSVGEILRVYEELENIERGTGEAARAYA